MIQWQLSDLARFARYYESRSHGRKVLAIVEGITSEGFYDLDVKKFADPRNLSPYIAT